MHLEIRRIEERFCPTMGRNIPLEVTYTSSGERSETCMGSQHCGCGKEGCVHRPDTLSGQDR